MLFGQKSCYNSALRFGHKNCGYNRFGQKFSNVKYSGHMTHEEDHPKQSDLERHTKEHHDYHTTHNHAHR